MSINNLNNPASLPTSADNLNRVGSDTNSLAASSPMGESFDWFNTSEGKALPIVAQTQFGQVATGDTSAMDEMVSAMLGHLGLASLQ